jgi:hypothetical protein
MKSKKYTFSKVDLLKIGKGAGFALGGALCAYLLTVLPDFEFGGQTLLISSVISILLNAGVKFFTGK